MLAIATAEPVVLPVGLSCLTSQTVMAIVRETGVMIPVILLLSVSRMDSTMLSSCQARSWVTTFLHWAAKVVLSVFLSQDVIEAMQACPSRLQKLSVLQQLFACKPQHGQQQALFCSRCPQR